MLVPLFQGGSYTSDSPNWAADRTVNLFTEVGESGATKSAMRLRGSPGLRLFCELPTAPVRGIWVNESRLFAAGGSRSYEVFPNAVPHDQGEIGDDATHTPVQMFPNGGQLFIVSAGQGYIDTGTEIIACELATLTGTLSSPGTIIVTRRGREGGRTNYPPTTNVDPLNPWFTVDWTSGDTFDPAMVGRDITLNGATFEVLSVRGDGKQMRIRGSAGVLANLTWTCVLPVLAKTGAFLDGYFIAAPPDDKRFRISSLYDGLTWDPLDYGVKQGYPDNISSILADHGDLWLLGTETAEIWRNTGNADFPYEKDLGAFIHQGCAATWSVVRLNNGVAWLGGDARGRVTAWRAQGYIPVRISTHGVEQAWRNYAEVSDAIGFVYRLDGHEFWQLQFPTAKATWVYDALTGLWHERDSWDPVEAEYGMHRARCYGYVWGKHFVGDYASGKIYEMSASFYDDDGTAIRRLRQAPHLSDEQLWHFFYRLQLDMETGSVVADPPMTLEWSDDGGHTWKTPLTITAGALNDFTKRVIWRRLGKSRDRVWRITSTAAIPHTWINAIIDVTKGTA
jgi:hypothetical protein